MSLIQIQGGKFQNFEGGALALGYLIMQLSHDEQEPVDPGFVTGAPKIKVTLDASGNIPVSPITNIWATDTLLPSGSFYTVYGYASDGALVFGPQQWTFSSGVSPYNVANIVPSTPPGSGLGGGSITGPVLETNGTVNSNQALLNLANGTNVTITNSAGTTTIAATGGPSFTTAGQGYFFGPGIFEPISAISRATGGSWVAASNTVYVVQFDLLCTFKVTKLSINVTANAIGKHGGFGIYSADGNTKYVDSGAMSLGSIAVVTSTIASVTLNPGTYFWAQTSDGTTAQLSTITTSLNLADANLFNANASFPRIALATNVSAAGVLPATLGALTAVTTPTLFDTALVMLEP